MRPRIANAVDKLRRKSDVYLASTFSLINNSTFRESYFSLFLSSSFSFLVFLFFYHPRCPMNRADSRERFFAYQTGVHYSRVCETRPGFTILIRLVIEFMHEFVRSTNRSASTATTVVFHGMTTYRHACARSLLSYISFSFFIPRSSYFHSCRSRVNR